MRERERKKWKKKGEPPKYERGICVSTYLIYEDECLDFFDFSKHRGKFSSPFEIPLMFLITFDVGRQVKRKKCMLSIVVASTM